MSRSILLFAAAAVLLAALSHATVPHFTTPRDYVMKTRVPFPGTGESFTFMGPTWGRYFMNITADGELRNQLILDCHELPTTMFRLEEGECAQVLPGLEGSAETCRAAVMQMNRNAFKFGTGAAEEDNRQLWQYKGPCDSSSPLAGGRPGFLFGEPEPEHEEDSELAALQAEAVSDPTGWCLREKGDNFVPLGRFGAGGEEEEIVTWWDPSPGTVIPGASTTRTMPYSGAPCTPLDAAEE